VTEVTVYTADHPGLFSRLAGALAVNGCNIVDAKIMTMTNGMALDTFWIQDQNGEPVDRPDKLARLSVAFENVLTGDLKPHREFARPPREGAGGGEVTSFGAATKSTGRCFSFPALASPADVACIFDMLVCSRIAAIYWLAPSSNAVASCPARAPRASSVLRL
jgi:hypothetical protein